MTKRQNRMVLVATLIAGAILAVTLLLQALESNANYFYSPTAVAEGKAPIGKSFRLGG
jgi:cytochrome c-type biogenesis protein CcmE